MIAMKTRLLKRLKRKANRYVRVEEYNDKLIIVDTRRTTKIEKIYYTFVNKFFLLPGLLHGRRWYVYDPLTKEFDFEIDLTQVIDLAKLYPHQRINMVVQAKRDFIIDEIRDMRSLSRMVESIETYKREELERKHEVKFLNSVRI